MEQFFRPSIGPFIQLIVIQSLATPAPHGVFDNPNPRTTQEQKPPVADCVIEEHRQVNRDWIGTGS